jgi:hypothetical protein
MSDYKKQHYVPKSYLKAWSLDGRRIWMFDKHTGRSRNVGIGSVAQETYFNDAFRRIRGQVTDGESSDLVERQFQTWENDFLTMRQVALDVAANRRGGSLEERRTMSICAAIQLMRTAKTRRALIREASESPSNQRNRLIDWLDEPLRERIVHVPGFAREHISLIQLCLLWNTDIIPHIATELYHYLWIVAKNETSFPFYTSDAPIAALTHGVEQPPFYPTPREYSGASKGWPLVKRLFCENPLERGLELILPVSPQCAVLMFHPFDFEKELGDEQGKVLVVGTESVLIRNIAIAGSTVRQVLSSTDDFRMAEVAVSHARGESDESLSGHVE